MAVYSEELTNSLRLAQIAALKQRYLDIINEANRDKETRSNEYLEESNSAFLEQQQAMRDRPQQLRALGLGGGIDDVERNSIISAYGEKISRLKRTLESGLKELDDMISVQNNRMGLELDEFNARTALEDFERTATPVRGGGGGGGKSSKKATSSKRASAVEEEDDFDYINAKKISPVKKPLSGGGRVNVSIK